MMVASAASYLSSEGDVLDAVIWRHYGRQDQGALELVLEANPGLADLGPILPPGLSILLPAIPDAQPRDGVRLWD